MKKIAMIAAAVLMIASCCGKKEVVLLPVSDFQTTVDGKEVSLYTL